MAKKISYRLVTISPTTEFITLLDNETIQTCFAASGGKYTFVILQFVQIV